MSEPKMLNGTSSALSVCEKCKISFTLSEGVMLKSLTFLFCTCLLELKTPKSICPLLITHSKPLLSSLK